MASRFARSLFSCSTKDQARNLLDVSAAPASATTDNTVPRFTGTSGDLQTSGVVIDDSDRMLFGTSSAVVFANYLATGTPPIQVHTTSSNSNHIGLARWNNNATSPSGLCFGFSRGTSVGSFTVVSSGDDLGHITWAGADGTDFAAAASIFVEVDGTPGNNDMPGAMHFQTSQDGSETPQTKISIHSDGGIRFPASQLASTNANTLDDYEEGTWTPAVTGSGDDPTVTYTQAVGVYTKIGRLVTYHGVVKLATFSGGTGNFQISLPFTPDASLNEFPPGTVALVGVDYAGSYCVNFPQDGSAITQIYTVVDNGASAYVPLTGFAASDEIYMSGHFNV